MMDILEVTHVGTTNVKRARKHALIQEYEMFKMLKGKQSRMCRKDSPT